MIDQAILISLMSFNKRAVLPSDSHTTQVLCCNVRKSRVNGKLTQRGLLFGIWVSALWKLHYCPQRSRLSDISWHDKTATCNYVLLSRNVACIGDRYHKTVKIVGRVISPTYRSRTGCSLDSFAGRRLFPTLRSFNLAEVVGNIP